MKSETFVLALVLAAAGVQSAVAATTLFIPGVDVQPITADIEGVDASGHTTWRVGPGVPSGTYTEDGLVVVSATLVAGPTDVHFVENDTADDFAVTEDCAISGGVAVCTVSGHIQGQTRVDIETDTVSGFEVQFDTAQLASVTGTAATPASTTADPASGTAASGSGGASGVSPTASAGSGVVSGVAPTGTGSGGAAPSATGNAGNGAGTLRVGFLLLVPGILALVTIGLF
ncbi:hypothetical protein OH77DRAFT_1429485 [Trametes cingulata]|nr:hypothetical protein OH77DRAFT_1429485 [Trametes cingulata]